MRSSIIMACALLGAAPAVRAQSGGSAQRVERKTCQAPDGVTLVYSAAGAGETALVFIHGGLADRTFFDGQLAAFADRYRVIALDLAGHGESGANRKKWGIPQFGADVKAVVDAEGLKRVILFGNSLGGPTAVEAALLMPDRVIGVVGVDTFQSVENSMTPEAAQRRAAAFRRDYTGAVKAMVTALLHPDANPTVVGDAVRRMLKTSPDVAYSMFLGMGGYEQAASVKRLTCPLRAINGDLFPTDVEAVRKTKPDFDAIIMKHVGHYPMLEQPEEFNKHVASVAEELGRSQKAPGDAERTLGGTEKAP